MIHDGTTATVVEEAAIATGDMLEIFTGDINNSNAELKVTMVSSGIATVTTIPTPDNNIGDKNGKLPYWHRII